MTGLWFTQHLLQPLSACMWNTGLIVSLTASKEYTPSCNLQSSVSPFLPAPVPRLCPPEQQCCILYCSWAPKSLYWIICALTCAVLALAWDFWDQPAWHTIRGCTGSFIWSNKLRGILIFRHSFLLAFHSHFTFQGEDGTTGQRSHWKGCLWLVGTSVLQVWYKLPAYAL